MVRLLLLKPLTTVLFLLLLPGIMMMLLFLLKPLTTMLFLLLQLFTNYCEASVAEAPHNHTISFVCACYNGEASVSEAPQNRCILDPR